MKQLSECPICASGKLRHSFTERVDEKVSFRVDRCEDCTHEFVNPQLDPSELEPYYQDEYHSWDQELVSEKHIIERVAEAKREGVYRHMPVGPGVDVMDFGCGVGLFLEVSHRLGANVFGIDMGKPNTDYLKGRGLDAFCGRLDDYLALGNDRRFDIITSSHVFEHLHDPATTLEQLGGLLKPGGMIWLCVPNAGNWGYRALRGKWFGTDLPRHLQQFNPKSMGRMIERAGLRSRVIRTESLHDSAAYTVSAYLRDRFWIPHSLSERCLRCCRGWVGWWCKRMDNRLAGDAVLAEITRDDA
jgi:2-polyprenyl-3-methyl-5-hydroxy-6-metoxy-1,4-benzoquinol methylase